MKIHSPYILLKEARKTQDYIKNIIIIDSNTTVLIIKIFTLKPSSKFKSFK